MIQTNLAISEIMTSEVIIIGPNDTMKKVADIFRAENIHHIPVVDEDGKVVGIISKTDYHKLQNTFTLFKTSKSNEYNEAIMSSMLVKEVMSKQVATLYPTDSILTAAAFFRENLFHAIPIVDNQKNLVGILSTYDLLNYAFREPLLLDDK